MLWLTYVKQWFSKTFSRWRKPPPPPPPPEPPPSQPPPPQPNREERRRIAAGKRSLDRRARALERERKKFDKFVEPKGPQPIKQERVNHHAPPTPDPTIEVPPTFRSGNANIEDHYDDDPSKPKVLYTEEEFWGTYSFRDTILDQLDRYWFYLERMRQNDPDAYAFYRQVGAQVVPYSATSHYGKAKRDKKYKTPEEVAKFKEAIFLPPLFKQNRPSFGCIAFGAHPKGESWEVGKSVIPKFMYYTKYQNPPPEVQVMAGGDIYCMTIWWDTPQVSGRKWGVPEQFAVFVSKDGEHLQVLRTCKTELIRVHKKRRNGYFRIPSRAWRIPNQYEQWAKSRGLDAQTWLTCIFCDAAKHVEYAQFGDVRVAVHKGALWTATFNIDARRMSYFFQDRDIQLTEHGARKRVFHVVRPHVRADGTSVKMHYRGLREFDWAGYHVTITVPGLDHFLLSEYDSGSVDNYWIAPKDKHKYITEEQFGARIAEQLKPK